VNHYTSAASTLKFGITICVNHRFFLYILNIAIPSFSVDAALASGFFSIADDFDGGMEGGAGLDIEIASKERADVFGGGMNAARLGGEDGAVDLTGKVDVTGDKFGSHMSVRSDGDLTGGEESLVRHRASQENVFNGDVAVALRAVDVGSARRSVDGIAAVDAAVGGADGRLLGEIRENPGLFAGLRAIGDVADHVIRSLHVNGWEAGRGGVKRVV